MQTKDWTKPVVRPVVPDPDDAVITDFKKMIAAELTANRPDKVLLWTQALKMFVDIRALMKK